MGFKKMDRNLSFAEYSLMGTLEKNRAVERLDKINSLINWERVEEIITAGYPVGMKDEGEYRLSSPGALQVPPPGPVVWHQVRPGAGEPIVDLGLRDGMGFEVTSPTGMPELRHRLNT